MKRLQPSEFESPPFKYAAANIPADMRTAFAVSYIAMERSGIAKSDFLNNLAEQGYRVDKRTFDRWLARVRSEGSAVSLSKASGAPTKVTESEVRILIGWGIVSK